MLLHELAPYPRLARMSVEPIFDHPDVRECEHPKLPISTVSSFHAGSIRADLTRRIGRPACRNLDRTGLNEPKHPTDATSQQNAVLYNARHRRLRDPHSVTRSYILHIDCQCWYIVRFCYCLNLQEDQETGGEHTVCSELFGWRARS